MTQDSQEMALEGVRMEPGYTVRRSASLTEHMLVTVRGHPHRQVLEHTCRTVITRDNELQRRDARFTGRK